MNKLKLKLHQNKKNKYSFSERSNPKCEKNDQANETNIFNEVFQSIQSTKVKK